MNCYTHHSVAAIGICKNCNKGLCVDCATEAENGIACPTCVDQVTAINTIINNSKKSTGRVAGSYYRAAFIYFAMSLLFFYSAWKYNDLKMYGIIAGCIFLIGGGLTINTARKYKKQ